MRLIEEHLDGYAEVTPESIRGRHIIMDTKGATLKLHPGNYSSDDWTIDVLAPNCTVLCPGVFFNIPPQGEESSSHIDRDRA